jgi:hypothetical protein
MPPVQPRFLAFVLCAAASCLSAAKAEKTESAKYDDIDLLSAKYRLLDLLKGTGVFQPPEIPTDCLDWSGSPKGDSVIFRPVMSGSSACSGLDPIKEVWILPQGGTTAFLVDGDDRTVLRVLAYPAAASSNDGRMLELLDDLTAQAMFEDSGILEGGDFDPMGADMTDVILAGGGGSIKNGERTASEPPTASDIEISGEGGHSRTPESILRVIRQNVGSFRYSYQSYLPGHPGLGGEISLQFTIAPSGNILDASVVRSNTGITELDDEILIRACLMKFDEVDGSNLRVTCHLKLDRK